MSCPRLDLHLLDSHFLFVRQLEVYHGLVLVVFRSRNLLHIGLVIAVDVVLARALVAEVDASSRSKLLQATKHKTDTYVQGLG